jgi:membrane protease YdiL (CAAX protease family)
MSLRCVERSMISKIAQWPALARFVPFAIFILLTSLQEQFGDGGRYWIYFAKTLAGAGMLAVIWQHIEELKWRFSWAAVVAGVAVFAAWVGLDGWYPRTDVLYSEHICPLLKTLGLKKECIAAAPSAAWNPHQTFGADSALAWLFIVVRILGSSLVVPPLEEVFYRSFVYRYIASKEFLSVPLSKFLPVPFVITALIFGFVHKEWLAGIFCACAYQGLVIWKGRLGDAMTAHAITNFLLGLWIVWRGAWHFW